MLLDYSEIPTQVFLKSMEDKAFQTSILLTVIYYLCELKLVKKFVNVLNYLHLQRPSHFKHNIQMSLLHYKTLIIF